MGLLVGVLVELAVWLLLLPRTPRKVMLTQAHPRSGGDCVASSGRKCSVPRWASDWRRRMLAGSHQWWCVDAVQSVSSVDIACRGLSAGVV